MKILKFKHLHTYIKCFFLNIIDWWATTFFWHCPFLIFNVFLWIGINSMSFLAIPIFLPKQTKCFTFMKIAIVFWIWKIKLYDFFITTKWIKVTCVIWIAKSSNQFYLWLVSYYDFSTSWTIFLHIFLWRMTSRILLAHFSVDFRAPYFLFLS